jgi:putative transposase
MVVGLERRQQEGHLHFVTFSCHHRLAYLDTPITRDLFEDALETVHRRYHFGGPWLCGDAGTCPFAAERTWRRVARHGLAGPEVVCREEVQGAPFWQPRYYDFNVFTEDKRTEKLGYIHWNPLRRGLVDRPEDWRWSSLRYHQIGVQGRVKIDSSWRAS